MKHVFKAAAGLFVLALVMLFLNQCSSAKTGPSAEPASASSKTAPGAADAAPLKVGDVAPDFTLPDQDGKPISLSQFRGKKNVVLAFYVLAFTGG